MGAGQLSIMSKNLPTQIVLICIFTGVFIIGACEQNPESIAITFSKTFGYDYMDSGDSVQETQDGGYIIAGTTNSYETLADIWMIKTDQNGEEEWSQIYGGNGIDRGFAVDQTNDGGFIIGGYTESFGNGLKDVWIIKTDSSGNTRWEYTFGDIKDDYCNDIKQTTDGGYIVCGATTLPHKGHCDIWLIKIDLNGTQLWDATFSYENSADQGFSVVETMSGDFVVAGYSSPGSYGFADLRLFKTDALGTLIWDKLYGGDDYDEGYAVCETMSGGLVVAGTSESFGNGLDDGWLIKTDSAGELEWEQIFGGDNRDIANDIAETIEGGFIMTGSTNSFNNGDYDNWVIKTDINGNMIWEQIYGGDRDDGGRAISQTSDGGYIITGYTYSFGTGNSDLWLLKIDSQGNY